MKNNIVIKKFNIKREIKQNPYTGIMSFQHFRGEKLYSDIVVRPEDVQITSYEDGMLKGKVTSVIFKGIHYQILVQCGRYEIERLCNKIYPRRSTVMHKI